MNSCQFTGRLGRDPETRYTQSGTAVCTFSIAVDSFANGQKGVTWIKVAAFEKQAELSQQYLHKGDLVGVSGEYTSREWSTKDNVKQTAVEIRAHKVDFLTPKAASAPAAQQNTQARGVAVADEDIPF